MSIRFFDEIRFDVHNLMMATKDRHQAASYPLRMPDELKAKVQAAADASGRSLHAELLMLIEKGLNAPEAFIRAPASVMSVDEDGAFEYLEPIELMDRLLKHAQQTVQFAQLFKHYEHGKPEVPDLRDPQDSPDAASGLQLSIDRSSPTGGSFRSPYMQEPEAPEPKAGRARKPKP